MKNITITLPDDTAKWVRIWAAEQEKSVSAALAELVEEKMRSKAGRIKALERFRGPGPRVLSDGKGYPSRDSLYER